MPIAIDERYLLGLLAGIIVGWFALGIIYNLRRGEAVLRWMQGGLPKLAERSSLKWLGSTVAQLVMERAKPPYRRIETLVVLAPRDAPWLWLWARLRGRRDTLIFRFVPVAPPRVAIEMGDSASWTARSPLEQVARQGWEALSFAWPNPAEIPTRKGASSPTATLAAAPTRVGAGPVPQENRLTLMVPQGLTDRAQEVMPHYLAALARLDARPWRFAVRRDPPMIELHLPFPDTRHTDAAGYFEALRELGKEV